MPVKDKYTERPICHFRNFYHGLRRRKHCTVALGMGFNAVGCLIRYSFPKTTKGLISLVLGANKG